MMSNYFNDINDDIIECLFSQLRNISEWKIILNNPVILCKEDMFQYFAVNLTQFTTCLNLSFAIIFLFKIRNCCLKHGRLIIKLVNLTIAFSQCFNTSHINHHHFYLWTLDVSLMLMIYMHSIIVVQPISSMVDIYMWCLPS